MAPQIIITLVFFIWPASQALYQSVLLEDAFGLRSEFVWLDNFIALFSDPHYLDSFARTVVFSAATAGLSLGVALFLAVMADRILKGATAYRTLIVWPYAVAPAVAGVLWFFMFNPSIGVLAYLLKSVGYDWNHYLDGTDAMMLVILAASWKQVSYNFLFFLAGLQAIPRSLVEAAAIDGARPFKRFWTIVFPPALADGFLPAGGQYRLRVLRHLRDRSRDHERRPGAVHHDPGLQGVQRRLHRA